MRLAYAKNILNEIQDLVILRYFLVLLLLYASTRYSFLLFHTIAEMLTIIVGVGMAALVWNARKLLRNQYLIFISIGMFFSSLINGAHMMSYAGMGIFPGYNSSLMTQLWISQRFLLASTFLAGTFVTGRRFSHSAVMVFYLTYTVIVMMMIFYWRNFPITYIDGIGMSLFKEYSEYVIAIMFALAVVSFRNLKGKIDSGTRNRLRIFLILSMLTELVFTKNVDMYGWEKISAHMLILISFYFVYKALVNLGFTKPYRLLFLELKAVSKQKDELLKMVSHEVRNPLASIRVYATLLSEGLVKQKGNKKRLKITRQIQQQVERINSLVSELDVMGILETGSMMLNISPLDLNKFLKDRVEVFRSQFPKYEFYLKANEVSRVDADQERLGQVIDNLLNNAVKYSAEKSRISIITRQEGELVILSVRDRGIGIDAANLPHIFEKYFRTEASRNIKGLGLGLYISKMIVDQHKGKIWVSSKIGKGSIFSVALPAR